MDILKMEFPMAVSYLNMKLRDRYGSLGELCEDLEIDFQDLENYIRENGYFYSGKINQLLHKSVQEE